MGSGHGRFVGLLLNSRSKKTHFILFPTPMLSQLKTSEYIVSLLLKQLEVKRAAQGHLDSRCWGGGE